MLDFSITERMKRKLKKRSLLCWEIFWYTFQWSTLNIILNFSSVCFCHTCHTPDGEKDGKASTSGLVCGQWLSQWKVKVTQPSERRSWPSVTSEQSQSTKMYKRATDDEDWSVYCRQTKTLPPLSVTDIDWRVQGTPVASYFTGTPLARYFKGISTA